MNKIEILGNFFCRPHPPWRYVSDVDSADICTGFWWDSTGHVAVCVQAPIRAELVPCMTRLQRPCADARTCSRVFPPDILLSWKSGVSDDDTISHRYGISEGWSVCKRGPFVQSDNLTFSMYKYGELSLLGRAETAWRKRDFNHYVCSWHH